MSDNNNDEKRTLNLPENINLPFFTYGIFKPGQLAHSKIRNHVKKPVKDAEINYRMKHRDGVPILIDEENPHFLTKGSLITFREGQEEETYGIISRTLLRDLYEWKTIDIDGQEVNVLFGVNPDNGSNYIEDNYEQVSFNGKNDPFFSEAIELIEKNLNSNEISWNMEHFFELQMNYMLLWSAIDRFSSLKYNKVSKMKNFKKFAQQKAFKKGIKRYENDYHQQVYSTDDLEMHGFDADDPEETLKYYYTLRCNVVHRGKAMHGDYDMLKKATEELLEIFKDVLERTFD